LAKPVWHCSVRAAPGDRTLSDDEWAQVACDIMHRTGLAPYGQEDDAVRWIAVRHAADHIHLVAMLARQDGTRPRLWNDYYQMGEACRAAEQRFGLRRTAPRDRTAARRPTRAESEKARRHGFQEAPRVALRRAVSTAAAGAASEQEFFARLDAAGISVRKRFSTRNPGEVTGYAVALTGETTATGGPVWFGGGKLAADLTLPKLRCRWDPARNRAAERFTTSERNAIWEHARPHRRRRGQAHPLHRPGRSGRSRCRLGCGRHAARGRGGAGQPGAPPGSRFLRPGRACPVRPGASGRGPGWDRPAPVSPAAVPGCIRR